MAANGLGMKTVKVINDLHRDGIKTYVALMRHSERPIGNATNDSLMTLTEEGKHAAYEFGRALPPASLIQFFSSKIDRCVKTSVLIEKVIPPEVEKRRPIQ
jgi:hypothetical protein